MKSYDSKLSALWKAVEAWRENQGECPAAGAGAADQNQMCALRVCLSAWTEAWSRASSSQERSGRRRGPAGGRVRPPAPPDTEWLKDGSFEEKEVVEDIPRALVLMPDMPGREEVVKAAAGVGYRVELADNAGRGDRKDAVSSIMPRSFCTADLNRAASHSGKFHQYHADHEHVPAALYFLCADRRTV